MNLPPIKFSVSEHDVLQIPPLKFCTYVQNAAELKNLYYFFLKGKQLTVKY